MTGFGPSYYRDMPFGPVDPQLDLVALERRVLARWRELDLANAVQRQWEGAPPWVFYEGPPTANGKPGLHHVWARAFKDLFPRFRTMCGHDVPRKGGWDCHGLPVEIEVEKELGFTRKQEIEEYGIGNFNARCRESVQRYVGDWEALTERAGVWIDTKDAYWTLSNEYVESVWWLVKQLFDKGLLYEGYRVIPYCSRCGTALSSHELGQPGVYRDVADPSVYVRFPLEGEDADLLVWTTTPWTLISNVAAAVGPDIDYVRVRDADGGRDLVMAEARAPEGAEVVARYLGTDLVGRRYRRPFDFLAIDERGQRVVAADFVSTEDGTGIVHLAPAFGVDDMDVAKVEDLPVLNPVGPDGTFGAAVTPWEGMWVKDADPGIAADLAARGLLVREQPYTHSYPHCWRCGTPLIYWAKTSWFVRTSDHRDDLLRENEKIGWYPEHIKEGRFGEWLRNNVDWALSRDRYWGTPLPIWRCDGTEAHDTCVGSVAELGDLAKPGSDGSGLATLDLHRPHVDDVSFACPEPGCGATAHRIAPVLDAWFDSGSMPSAQHHYPFGDKQSDGRAQFESAFPADFICEAVDQTRGWFYSLLAVNTLVFDSTPYKNVVVLGFVVDEFGQKMSKSKGNVIDPWQIFDAFGADALRWYFFSAGSPWTNRRVFEDGIREATRKTLITLWNVFAFFATYADLEGFQPDGEGGVPHPGEPDPEVPEHVLDRWLEARLAQTVGSVTAALEGFDAMGASNDLAAFVDDLSNWYVRRSRPRFWGSSEARSPDAVAYAVLHRALTVTCRLLAPFCPFLADELFVTLAGEVSVHLQRWPEAGAFSDQLLSEMESARRLVGLGRAARTDAGVRTRQPLRRAMLLHPGVRLSDDVRREIAEELNVKALEDVGTLSDLMSWEVVPNFRALGPRLGAKVNQVKQALAAADGSELRRQLEADGYIEVAGEKLGPTDVEVRAHQHEEYAVAHDDDWAVAIDLELDDELRLEGLARQLARDLNDLRRQRDLSLADRINVVIDGGDGVAAVLDSHAAWIASQILATSLTAGPVAGDDGELSLDGEPIRVDLQVATGGG